MHVWQAMSVVQSVARMVAAGPPVPTPPRCSCRVRAAVRGADAACLRQCHLIWWSSACAPAMLTTMCGARTQVAHWRVVAEARCGGAGLRILVRAEMGNLRGI
jgi:hypothetical protein